MLAGLIHLGACRAAGALRGCAAAGTWPELVGQAIERTGNAAMMVFLVLVASTLLVVSAFLLWPLAAAAMFGLALRICQVLLQRARR